MITLRNLLDILPGTLIDFLPDSWIQVYDDATGRVYRPFDDSESEAIFLGNMAPETYSDFLNRKVTCIQQSRPNYLDVYVK